MFCDACGGTIAQVQVARKLRQSSFDTVKDAKDGLLSPGERIKGRYQYVIEEAIARSGFGATFRAQRTSDGKQLLIKQMLDQPNLDAFKTQLMKSFKREAKFLRKIKHPAFPRGHEYFERNKSFFLVMDFINGKELAKAVEDYRKKHAGKIEDGLIVHMGIEIADALQVIHSQGYLYRDLKPQNVMLDGISSKVKLIDFGTLHHSSDREPLIFESEGYTPPDLLKKETFSAAGDIYSLGALLYEIAMGETPLLGEAKKIDSTKRDPRLLSIIKKCLEVDPSKRYQKATHVRDELQKLTRKGFWPFGNPNRIAPVELNVLPKTLYPPSCTFCEFCGHADANSHAGYCQKCRVPLRVGRVSLKIDKDKEKEFFLYADETLIGSASQCHFAIHGKDKDTLNPQHVRIFRRKTSLYIESIEKNKDNTLVNRRKVVGPVELLDGDTIELGTTTITFSLKDAC